MILLCKRSGVQVILFSSLLSCLALPHALLPQLHAVTADGACLDALHEVLPDNRICCRDLRDSPFERLTYCGACPFWHIGEVPAPAGEPPMIAVPNFAALAKEYSPKVVNVSTTVFDLGIEEHRLEGQTVRIYSLARTVADCFRFRNKVGLDVALEALTEAWRSKRLKLDDLNRIAKKLRVQRVMQPYLETVVM